MWQHLWWYERFVSACQLTHFSKNWTVPNLALHWNWLKAKTLAPVFKGHRYNFPALVKLCNILGQLLSCKIYDYSLIFATHKISF